jgi:hypothetical protein
VEDHHVDRPDVEARRRVKLTGTNRSFDLIALVAKARDCQSTRFETEKMKSQFCFIRSLPAWWPLQGDKTRSHPELGRQTP